MQDQILLQVLVEVFQQVLVALGMMTHVRDRCMMLLRLHILQPLRYMLSALIKRTKLNQPAPPIMCNSASQILRSTSHVGQAANHFAEGQAYSDRVLADPSIGPSGFR